MKTVRLSLRAARAWHEDMMSGRWDPDLVRELEAAISRSTRASATRKRLGAPKRAKKATKRQRTAGVREAVMARARGVCECGCLRSFSETFFGQATLDHFEGKARSETLETCWALRAGCHSAKTENHPSASAWLHRFIAHCEKHTGLGDGATLEDGYSAAAERALARLAFVTARAGVAP